jgi:hypothetical protein
MIWQKEYPTVATVNAAAFTTLQAWDEHLPPAQTDVERAVRRRIKKALFDRAVEEVREKAPDIADKWNGLMDQFERITGARGTRRM